MNRSKLTAAISGLGESALIDLIMKYEKNPLPPGAIGVGDDGAYLPLNGGVVTSTDMLVEGEDFMLSWASGQDIGHKALAVNISDLAAMGSRPAGYLFSLAINPEQPLSLLADIAAGLAKVAQKYNCPLIGGDLSATSGPLTINITVFGHKEAPLLRRGSGHIGDDIYVAGYLGGARAGLNILLAQPSLKKKFSSLVKRQLRPEPLLNLGLALAKSGLATSAMDISDGLVADLPRLLPKGHGANFMPFALPFAPNLKRYAKESGASLLELAMLGGEDYAILFTAAPEAADKIAGLAKDLALPINKIGTIRQSKGIKCCQGPEKWPLRQGFDHFS